MRVLIYFLLGAKDEIIQIAAKHKQSGDIFNRYVYPSNKNISNRITSITGLEIYG